MTTKKGNKETYSDVMTELKQKKGSRWCALGDGAKYDTFRQLKKQVQAEQYELNNDNWPQLSEKDWYRVMFQKAKEEEVYILVCRWDVRDFMKNYPGFVLFECDYLKPSAKEIFLKPSAKEIFSEMTKYERFDAFLTESTLNSATLR